ncbi:heme ABC transporter permease [Salmonella enterica subsp. enterica]|uniref:cytochrome c biogenesis protein CcsA n=1 Tax=Salmonella enterica TaxID=28901 RepID=UPI00117AC6E6|nr:cytochrome c biogenesis protein CcsA [Salmonella enterica]TRN90578.1 heme ABC transporter permease [Salmonella enterica subsp. enterica]
MWKTLHQLAAPPRLYQICGRLVPWLAAAGIIALATGWVRGFGFAPADYQQGESYRIMYLHVPAAIWSMGIYAANAFDDRKMAGRAAGILVLVGVVNLPVIHYSVEWWNTLHQGSTRMQQSIDPAMRSPLRWAIAGFLLLFMTLALMRMRNLILLMEKRRPWVSELILKRGHR